MSTVLLLLKKNLDIAISSATSLAFRAMQAYNRQLAEHLRHITTTAYLDDASGWTGLRRCGHQPSHLLAGQG